MTAKLDANRVRELLADSLFKSDEVKDGEIPADAVIVEGIQMKVGMKKERLESYRQEVTEMLAELPENFHKSGGGGWTFLNACMDKQGNQWGEHSNVDELLILGQGLGLVTYCLPRELWSVLPGGMPYFVVDLQEQVEKEKP